MLNLTNVVLCTDTELVQFKIFRFIYTYAFALRAWSYYP